MKKLISILLICTLLISLAACGKKATSDPEVNSDTSATVTDDKTDNTAEDEALSESNDAETSEKEDESTSDSKPVTETKPQNTQKPAVENAKPEDKPQPETKPETVPEVKPQEKPEQTPEAEPSTVAQKLLADFKAKAPSMGVLPLAEALVANPAIKFSGAAMPVSEGLLAGFGNTEIKGFKEGAAFMPMIGSIAFIGYVFELDDASSVPGFISTLKSNADLRWNICVEADEMVSGSVGTKVFFVMSPFSLED